MVSTAFKEKKKCEYCDYEGNAGHVARHINLKHPEHAPPKKEKKPKEVQPEMAKSHREVEAQVERSNMQISVSEFLEKVDKLEDKDHKVQALRANDSLVLRIILQGAFDPKVQWMLPPGDPPYKPNDLVDQQHILLADCEKIRYFIKGFHDNLSQMKREKMFIEFLERLDPGDAKLLLACKEKKLPFNNISKEMIQEAFPGMIQ